MLKTTFALLLSTFLAALPVRGSVITHSTPYSFTYSLADALGDTSSGTAVRPLTRNTTIDPLAVEAFDSSLGTLTGVTVTLHLSLSSAQFILHNSLDSQNPSILEISNFDVGYVLTQSSSVSGSFFAVNWVEAATGKDERIVTGANNLGSFSGSKDDTKTLSLTNYAGMTKDGQLLFSLFLSGDITINNTHPLFPYLSAEGEATVSGSLSVTYEYDAIPEPGAALLLFAGVLPLAGRFRGGMAKRG